jgi:phospholipid/cholesterol/gamma-HCH transport system ATP-binding protein
MTTSPAASDEPLVRLVHVEKSFGSRRVLRDVTIDVPRGKATVIIGPSGCGKSVLLKHIVALLRPTRGEVWFDGTRIDPLSESALVPVRRQIGFLFQQGALFDSMSVRENIEFPLLEHTTLSATQRMDRVRGVLDMVGLASTMDQMPGDLSGGQRKRIALARAVILHPTLILYDEPTTGLDPIRSDVINELILKLERELGVTSIIVTHDMISAFKLADRMIMLHQGRVLLQGPPETFRQSTDPLIQRFLLGEATELELEAIRGTRPRTETTA